jgi:hypothetical protein
MFLVAICGVDVFLLNKIGSDPRTYGVEPCFGELILIGGLPMANVLAFRTLIRTPGRPSFDPFLLGGSLALMLYLGVASVACEAIRRGAIDLLELLAPLRNQSLARLAWRISMAVLINLAPQIVVAGIIGLAILAWQRRDVPDALLETPSLTQGPSPGQALSSGESGGETAADLRDQRS